MLEIPFSIGLLKDFIGLAAPANPNLNQTGRSEVGAQCAHRWKDWVKCICFSNPGAHSLAPTSGEIYAVRAALSGSEEMSAAHQELLAGYVQLFASALERHSLLPPDELYRRCVGLVGAGEALCMMMVGGQCSEPDAATAFSALIRGGLQPPSSQS